MRYRRAYIEITSACNLDCSFCVHRGVHRGNLPFEDFKMIADQLPELTDTVYYHVLGEPLLHPDLDRMMEYVNDLGMRSAITTNGLLLKNKAEKWKGLKISRINISLHAYIDENNGLTLQDAMQTVKDAETVQRETGAAVFYRLWDAENPDQKELEAAILNRYGKETDPENVYKPNGMELAHGFRLSKERKFVWPVNASKGTERGFCQGLRTHFAVLADGTVVPCCLDAAGEICLGNAKEKPLKEILDSEKAKTIYNGFTGRKAAEELCRKCEYKGRFGG